MDLLYPQISMLEKSIIRISLSDIIKTTNNFSHDNVIGMGQMGIMYKLTLFNNLFLAVKKFHTSPNISEQFLFEAKTLIKLRHYNIVQLLGFCIDSQERLLAYEYLSNGNLYDWLHPNEGESSNIDWPLRVKIAIGVARGLIWLHNKIGIAHLDIRSKCILLDQYFEPKLSNFRWAMHLNQNSNRITQMNYVTEDVYSFGVVLLELITGKEDEEIENH